MKFVALSTTPTKSKFEVFIDGKLVLTTFDAFTAECERQMAWGEVEIRVTQVAK